MTITPSKPRPLSPHLGIYKPQISSVMSILHRATGVGLAIGLVVLVAWLVFLAGGPEAYAQFTDNLKNVLGQLALFGALFLLLWCIFHMIVKMVVSGDDPSSTPIKLVLGLLNFLVAAGVPSLACYLLVPKFPDISGAVFTYTGEAVLIGFTWAFFYHFWCGIRHLMWDAGWFLTIRGMHITGWIVLLLATASAASIWLKIEWKWVESILTKMGVHVG